MSSRVDDLALTIDEMRPLVLQALSNCPQTQYLNLCRQVAYVAVQKSIVPNPLGKNATNNDFELCNKDEIRVREIIWDLVVERVMTIGNNNGPAWPWLSLTEYGQIIVKSTEPTPHDPSGYLSRFQKAIPEIDPVILTYLLESLQTYRINAVLSSTIALGCASEKALLLLIDAYKNAIIDMEKRETFRKKVDGKYAKIQFDEIRHRIKSLSLPHDISDGLDTALFGIFDMIRKNRNSAGHPSGEAIPRDQIFASLQVFITYCKTVYQLINYLNENPIIT